MGKSNKVRGLRGLLPNKPPPKPEEMSAEGGRLWEADRQKMIELVESLNDAAHSFLGEEEPTLAGRIARFAKVRELKYAAGKVEKILGMSQQRLEVDLKAALEQWQMSSVSGDAHTAYLEVGVWCSVEDADALRNWLNSTNQGELLSLHSGTLRSLAEAHLTEGKGPIPGVKVYFHEKARVRKK